MLSNILKIGVSLLLLYLCFKHGSFGIDPLILGHCLECVLVRDVYGPLQTQPHLQVLADQLSERLVLQNVQLSGLVVVEDLEVHRVVLHTVLDTLRVDNG